MTQPFSASPVLNTVLRQLEDWLAAGQIRAIDLQLARQIIRWEQDAGNDDDAQLAGLMLAACAVSMALGRGQVCLTLDDATLRRLLPGSSLLALISLPVFNSFMEKDMTLNPLVNPEILVFFVGITLLVGIVSGSYPAFYLSSFQAIGVFRENFTQGASGLLRKFLVVFQFAISIVLIFG